MKSANFPQQPVCGVDDVLDPRQWKCKLHFGPHTWRQWALEEEKDWQLVQLFWASWLFLPYAGNWKVALPLAMILVLSGLRMADTCEAFRLATLSHGVASTPNWLQTLCTTWSQCGTLSYGFRMQEKEERRKMIFVSVFACPISIRIRSVNIRSVSVSDIRF